MIYLVYGEEEYLIDSYINDEIKKKKLEVINKYEYPKTSILEVIDDSMYLDLFGGSKGIVYKNCAFLNSKDDNISELVKYINNPNPEVCLFITLNESKIDLNKNPILNRITYIVFPVWDIRILEV